jgi:hypothetical protein
MVCESFERDFVAGFGHGRGGRLFLKGAEIETRAERPANSREQQDADFIVRFARAKERVEKCEIGHFNAIALIGPAKGDPRNPRAVER